MGKREGFFSRLLPIHTEYVQDVYNDIDEKTGKEIQVPYKRATSVRVGNVYASEPGTQSNNKYIHVHEKRLPHTQIGKNISQLLGRIATRRLKRLNPNVDTMFEAYGKKARELGVSGNEYNESKGVVQPTNISRTRGYVQMPMHQAYETLDENGNPYYKIDAPEKVKVRMKVPEVKQTDTGVKKQSK